jgi:hypothetical protein
MKNNKKKEFGDNYEKIQKKICQIKGIDKNLTIEELANKVIKGEFGNDEERKNKLGELYPIVQNRVNEIVGSDVRLDIDKNCIQILANRVIKGEFGDGDKRKEKLGELYPLVQNKVNEITGDKSIIYEEKPLPSYVKLN